MLTTVNLNHTIDLKYTLTKHAPDDCLQKRRLADSVLTVHKKRFTLPVILQIHRLRNTLNEMMNARRTLECLERIVIKRSSLSVAHDFLFSLVAHV